MYNYNVNSDTHVYLAKLQPDCWHQIRKEVKKHRKYPDKQTNRKHYYCKNANRFNITYNKLQNQIVILCLKSGNIDRNNMY